METYVLKNVLIIVSKLLMRRPFFKQKKTSYFMKKPNCAEFRSFFVIINIFFETLHNFFLITKFQKLKQKSEYKVTNNIFLIKKKK